MASRDEFNVRADGGDVHYWSNVVEFAEMRFGFLQVGCFQVGRDDDKRLESEMISRDRSYSFFRGRNSDNQGHIGPEWFQILVSFDDGGDLVRRKCHKSSKTLARMGMEAHDKLVDDTKVGTAACGLARRMSNADLGCPKTSSGFPSRWL